MSSAPFFIADVIYPVEGHGDPERDLHQRSVILARSTVHRFTGRKIRNTNSGGNKTADNEKPKKQRIHFH